MNNINLHTQNTINVVEQDLSLIRISSFSFDKINIAISNLFFFDLNNNISKPNIHSILQYIHIFPIVTEFFDKILNYPIKPKKFNII